MPEYPIQIRGLDIAPADDGFIIYMEDTDRVHYLNHIAGIILLLCNGRNQATGIASLLKQQFELPEPPLSDVATLLAQFVDEGLIVIKNSAV